MVASAACCGDGAEDEKVEVGFGEAGGVGYADAPALDVDVDADVKIDEWLCLPLRREESVGAVVELRIFCADEK